ncbi:MAG TPA: hypothetical protein VNE00_21015 [Paraburkholderia sp.]|jgi:hypothetical protein|nr:hypothetical protein [Paraburkholderia sp.]
MSDHDVQWESVDYEGFEIHLSTRPKQAASPGETQAGVYTEPYGGAYTGSYTYIGFVCHPGANPALPGHTVPFHADGEASFRSPQDARDEAVYVGKSIIEGTHPDLSVLALVTSGV